MKSEIVSILRSPITKQYLKLSIENRQIVSNDEKEVYIINGEVPILLPGFIMNKEETERYKHIDHYEKDAELSDYFADYPLSWRLEFKRLHSEIKALMKLKNNSLILDVGSGGGWLIEYVINKTKSSIVSMDLSTKNITKLKTLYKTERYTGIVGDAMNIPLANNSFDYVVASEVIEHVPDPKEFINNLFAVLKPGGKLIISTPYKEKIVYSLCVHCNQATPHSAHLHSFDEGNLLKLARFDNARVNYKLINHWWLIKTRMHIVFTFLPKCIWRLLDKTLIFLFKKPSRIILVIEKLN